MVAFDGDEASVLSSSATVWLGGDGIVLGDGDEIIFNFFNQGLISKTLVRWNKWMEIGETVPCDGDHADS